MKMLYRYPQSVFHDQKLVEENIRRARNEPEYELLDTGILDDDRFFDVVKVYLGQPCIFQLGQSEYSLAYQPAESETWLFGAIQTGVDPYGFPLII